MRCKLAGRVAVCHQGSIVALCAARLAGEFVGYDIVCISW